MANKEHLKILKQGVEVWNRWREGNPDIHPDLSFIDVNRTHLSRANFSEANLRGADLSQTDLNEADLSRTYLAETNFGKANLQGAKLISANFLLVDLIETSFIGPNPSVANLKEANLQGAHLGGAYLAGAILNNADLSRASLIGASLFAADLSGAVLIQADLKRVNLTRADLTGTDFRGSDLIWTNLSETILDGADFSEARMGSTVFGYVDLSVVKGLDTVKHYAPSNITIETLHRSKGQVPEVFLRGVGLSDTFITYIASLIGQAIQYYSCFISYSSQDEAFAQRLYTDLQQKGVRCWFAPDDMKIGDKIRSRIDESIRIHDKLLLILSQNSLNSFWVESEVEKAFEEERQRSQTVLFPVRLDEAVMETSQPWAAEIRRTRHIGDFSRWKDHDEYQKAFERLLRDLKAGEDLRS